MSTINSTENFQDDGVVSIFAGACAGGAALSVGLIAATAIGVSVPLAALAAAPALSIIFGAAALSGGWGEYKLNKKVFWTSGLIAAASILGTTSHYGTVMTNASNANSDTPSLNLNV